MTTSADDSNTIYPTGFRASVVVPVFNEVKTLERLVSRIRACGAPCEIILVDDGSTDGTRELLEAWRDNDDMTIRLANANRGKGAALRTGFSLASGDVVVVQDADLEYDPNDYHKIFAPILAGDADVVYGSRYLGRTERNQSFWRYHGNRFLTSLSNCFTRFQLTDMETCYKAFRREVIAELAPRLREDGFGIEPEITARLAGMDGVRLVEVSISYNARSYDEGKKIRFRDAAWAVRCILKYRSGG